MILHEVGRKKNSAILEVDGYSIYCDPADHKFDLVSG